MKVDSLIIKFDDFTLSEKYSLNRLVGWVPLKSAVDLVAASDLQANPRAAKISSVTDEIEESISKTPDIFHFKTKGLLLAAGGCDKLDRGRFRLNFEDHEIEGILDGGHNLLACGLYMATNQYGDSHRKEIKRIKRWEDLEAFIEENPLEYESLDLEEFLLPVEVIFPKEDAEGRDAFEHAILDVARARNNNAQLTLETKAHKAGYYDFVKECLQPEIAEEIEWKTNDGGRIKARDIISLAWVPLSKLDSTTVPGVREFNPVNTYRNKGACTAQFNKLMESDHVTQKVKGEVRELHNPIVMSALMKLEELPKLYDKIYEDFPGLYNDASSGFGRISSVRLYVPGKYKKGEKKYLRAEPVTKFYQEPCVYDYPDGFIMPIVWGLRELMHVDGDELVWKVDPFEFLDNNLGETLKVYYGFVQMANYDPQKVGKALASYQMICNDFRSRL